MKIERFPLQDRLALLDTGRCAHPEYAAAIIHRFADMTLPEYFQGFEAELERLRSTLGLSREQVQSMTCLLYTSYHRKLVMCYNICYTIE